MCLAVPMEVLNIDGNRAWVSAGGTKREVRLDVIDQRPHIGDYVIVHAGFAIHRIDQEMAKETLKMFEEMFSNEAPG
ncbi:MAG TPA: HypC/HybG/HupF family hydrogenase formation chaperone [Syntrophaceae bacterium]|nr:HypC/HybG/HupF family hydrogenase formation chaperone [Syntrophaceae bacterium]